MEKDADSVGELMMIERQVIVTWYTPEEKLPADDNFMVVTISGKVGGVTYDHAFAIADYCEGEGWYIDGIDPEVSDANISVNAWCDLEPYGI